MKRHSRSWMALVVLSVLSIRLQAKEFPPMNGWVNDAVGVLSIPNRQALSQAIAETERATSAEVVVVTVSSLNGLTVEDYAHRLFNEWGIGKKGKNNGVLILIAPNDRKMRIEVGYGLEAILPDGLAGDIIRNQMAPAFKAGDYNRGIMDGTRRVLAVIQENKPAPEEERETDASMKITRLGELGLSAFFSVFVGLGFFMLGAGWGSRTFFPMLWGSFFGGIPLFMAMSGAFGDLPRILLVPLAIGVAFWGHRIGGKPTNFLRGSRLTGSASDGWTWGASGGSGSGGSGGGGGGGSSGGGGASGSW